MSNFMPKQSAHDIFRIHSLVKFSEMKFLNKSHSAKTSMPTGKYFTRASSDYWQKAIEKIPF